MSSSQTFRPSFMRAYAVGTLPFLLGFGTVRVIAALVAPGRETYWISVLIGALVGGLLAAPATRSRLSISLSSSEVRGRGMWFRPGVIALEELDRPRSRSRSQWDILNGQQWLRGATGRREIRISRLAFSRLQTERLLAALGMDSEPTGRA